MAVLLKNRHLYLMIILHICSIYEGFGQQYFNYISKQSKVGLIYNEAFWYKDTLSVFGTYVDSQGLEKVNYSKFNPDLSNVVFENINIDTSEQFFYHYFSKGVYLEDSKLFKLGYKAYYNDEEPNDYVMQGVIHVFDSTGSILLEKNLLGKYYPMIQFMKPNSFVLSDSSLYITYLSWTFDDDINAHICVLKINSVGQIEWDSCYGDMLWDFSTDIVVDSEGNSYVIGYSNNFSDGDWYWGTGNGVWQGFIIKISPSGNLLWEWKSDNMESANAAYLENDSVLVVAAGYASENCATPGSSTTWCQFDWTTGIYKFNLNSRLKAWETKISGCQSNTFDSNRFYDIERSIEGDGYILAGSGYNLAYPGCEQIDTQKCFSFPGIIAKVSNEGDSLWFRKYFGVQDIYENNTIYDISITPSSGYCFVGNAYDPFPDGTQGSYGWILITDEYGCLYSKCDSVSSVKIDYYMLPNSLNVYPNPASDHLNIHFDDFVTGDYKLVIYNSIGQIVKYENEKIVDQIKIISLGDLISGVYYLKLVDKHGYYRSTKFVLIK